MMRAETLSRRIEDESYLAPHVEMPSTKPKLTLLTFDTPAPTESIESFFGDDMFTAVSQVKVAENKPFLRLVDSPIVESMRFETNEDSAMSMEDFFDDAFGDEDKQSEEREDIIAKIDLVLQTPKEDRSQTFDLFTSQKDSLAAAAAAINCCPPIQHNGSTSFASSIAPAQPTPFGGGKSEHKSGAHEHCACGKDAEEGKSMCKDCLTAAEQEEELEQKHAA